MPLYQLRLHEYFKPTPIRLITGDSPMHTSGRAATLINTCYPAGLTVGDPKSWQDPYPDTSDHPFGYSMRPANNSLWTIERHFMGNTADHAADVPFAQALAFFTHIMSQHCILYKQKTDPENSNWAICKPGIDEDNCLQFDWGWDEDLIVLHAQYQNPYFCETIDLLEVEPAQAFQAARDLTAHALRYARHLPMRLPKPSITHWDNFAEAVRYATRDYQPL